MEYVLNERIRMITGDITSLQVDAVVNAANSSLMGGGGVDGAIHRAGGASILEECRSIRQHRYPQGLPTGKAVITGGGDLPSRWVIHTVGPVWHGGDQDEPERLKDAYQNSLMLATETGVKTLAFPAISTGIYGFPKELAAPIVIKTISEYLAHNGLPREIVLVFFKEGDLNSFRQVLEDR